MRQSLILVFCALATTLTAQINFLEGSWNDALNAAREKDQMILIDAYTDWCGPCKQMAATTFMDSAIGVFVNTNFIPYKMDMEKGEGPEFAKKYNVRAYPTIMFIDADGILIHKSVGFKAKGDFQKLCEEALDPALQLRTVKEEAERTQDPAIIKKYLFLLADAYETDEALFDSYWKLTPDDEKYSEENLNLLSLMLMTTGLDDPYLHFLLDHKAEYTESLGSTDYESTVRNVFERFIYSSPKEESETVRARLDSIKQVFPSKAQEVDPMFALHLLDEKASKKEQTKKRLALAEVSTNPYFLNYVAYHYYKHSLRKKRLRQALVYSQRAEQITPYFNGLCIKAGLEFRLKKYEEAKKSIDQAFAIAAASSYPVDTTSGEDLRKDIEKKLK